MHFTCLLALLELSHKPSKKKGALVTKSALQTPACGMRSVDYTLARGMTMCTFTHLLADHLWRYGDRRMRLISREVY
jgi:hypothetical protein